MGVLHPGEGQGVASVSLAPGIVLGPGATAIRVTGVLVGFPGYLGSQKHQRWLWLVL